MKGDRNARPVLHRGPAHGRADLSVAAVTVGEAVTDFDAALHRMEKQLRLSEYRLALLLEGLERLNADLAEAAQGLEAGL